MKHPDNFYTLKGYSLLEHASVTASEEDYLEMICRLSEGGKPLRIGRLAECLHVKPSSASKMVSNLKEGGYVDFERYGMVTLKEKGRSLGDYLLFRHDTLHKFFCYINGTDDELKQVEKVEHFMDSRTVFHLESFLKKQGVL